MSEDTLAQQALENVKEVIKEDDYQILEGAINKNVIALGTSDVFTVRDKRGTIRGFRQRVHLSAAEKTLVFVAGQYIVSAQGYDLLAEATGTTCIFPPRVLVGGDLIANPYAERDPNNRRILAVYARAVAWRFSSKGIQQVSDWMHIFDVPSYRMIDFLAKAKKKPHQFQLIPKEYDPPSEDGRWSKYEFDESTNLWINVEHEEALQWFKEIIHREKKSIDFAQTFAKRNAIKHLLGIQAVPGQIPNKPIDHWDLTVFCWRPVDGSNLLFDYRRYEDAQQRIDRLLEEPPSENMELTKGIEREAGQDEIEDIDAEDKEPIEAEFSTKEQADTGGVTAKTKPSKDLKVEQEPPQDEQKPAEDEQIHPITANYRSIRNQFPDLYQAACEDLGLPTHSEHEDASYMEHSLEDQEKIIDRGSRILDGDLDE